MFGRKLERPWLSSPGTAEGHFRVKLHVCAAFCSGTGLRSRNSQTFTTHFHISELGNLVHFSTLSMWDFSTADNSFVQMVVHGGKNNVLSNRDFPRTGDHSWVGPPV